MSMTPTLAAHLTSARACHPHTRSSQAWADPWAGRYAVGRCTEGHSGRQCQELTHAFPAQNRPRSSTAQILLCNARCRGGVSVAPDIGSTLLGAARARDTHEHRTHVRTPHTTRIPHAYTRTSRQEIQSNGGIPRMPPARFTRLTHGTLNHTEARHFTSDSVSHEARHFTSDSVSHEARHFTSDPVSHEARHFTSDPVSHEARHFTSDPVARIVDRRPKFTRWPVKSTFLIAMHNLIQRKRLTFSSLRVP